MCSSFESGMKSINWKHVSKTYKLWLFYGSNVRNVGNYWFWFLGFLEYVAMSEK